MYKILLVLSLSAIMALGCGTMVSAATSTDTAKNGIAVFNSDTVQFLLTSELNTEETPDRVKFSVEVKKPNADAFESITKKDGSETFDYTIGDSAFHTRLPNENLKLLLNSR